MAWQSKAMHCNAEHCKACSYSFLQFQATLHGIAADGTAEQGNALHCIAKQGFFFKTGTNHEN